jgi:hypothetical protein
MANPNLSAADMSHLLEMVINAPVGSYINAVSRQPLVNRFIELHNQVKQGARVDALNAAEAASVDAVRANAAKAAAPAQTNKPGKPANLQGGTGVGSAPAVATK